MNRNRLISACPDCEADVSRREFIRTAAGAVAAVAASPLIARLATAAPTPASGAESAVRQLYDGLTDEQRKMVVLPLDDERRQRINANWRVTEAKLGTFFSKEQQAIIRQIVKGATSEDGYDRLLRQTADDAGGIENYAVAIFGDPHGVEFEFELTGRHRTLRADGNTLGGAAFGGPIVYGHGAPGNSDKNLFWYQTKRANEVFAALDGKQRETALLDKAPAENAVQLRDDTATIPGLACRELSGDQQELVAAVLRDILQPYRQEDVDEVMEIVKAGGGMEQVRIAFYRSGDLGDDQVWDVWRLEGPTLVCHFRGAPHVHAYVNVARRS